MVDSIIKNFENYTSEGNGSATLGLRINSTLKKLGFSKAIVGREYVKKDTLEDGLTIQFMPYFDDGIDYYNRNPEREGFREFIGHMRGFEGSYYYDDYYSLRPNAEQGQVSLKIKFDGGEYEIGHYVPFQNLVLIYLPMDNNWGYGLDNKYILRILSLVKEVCGKYEFKTVDVAEAKMKLLIGKFTADITNDLKMCEDRVFNAKRDKENYEENITSCYRTIMTESETAEGLKKFIVGVQNGLMEKIDDIKKLKFVKDVSMTGEGIELKFDEIFIEDRDKKVRMGNYTVTLTPKKIKIVNDEPVERNGEMYHSCHIDGSSICFGEQQTMAYKLLGEFEFKKLAHFLWMYLNSYNEGDTYIPMRDWIAGRENNNVVPTNDYLDDDDDYDDGDDDE